MVALSPDPPLAPTHPGSHVFEAMDSKTVGASGHHGAALDLGAAADRVMDRLGGYGGAGCRTVGKSAATVDR